MGETTGSTSSAAASGGTSSADTGTSGTGDAAAEPLTPGQRAYDRAIARRLWRADALAWLRSIGIQAVWLVVLVAGAAVPLSNAVIDEGWGWVSPTLGFVIVVAAGLERIFRRTTDAAIPLDQLRRSIARERRMLQAGTQEYADPAAGFSRYAERVEAHIAEYDRQMLSYGQRVLGAD